MSKPDRSLDVVREDPRVEKLPKWAQDHIALLRMRLSEARTAVEETNARGPVDTDTLADPYRDAPIMLPKGVLVVFKLDGDYATIEARIIEHPRRRTHLEVRSSGHRGGHLLVAPQSSDMIQLTTSGWR